jgi:uncharacterized repeat protein (TIGR03803 family)
MWLGPRTRVLLNVIAFAAMTLSAGSSAWAASKYKVLYSFKSGTDGNFPSGALVFDTAGNLYGTTVNGGSSGTCLYGQGTGCGIVFQLKPNQSGNWTENVLHRFQGGSDGANPNGSPIFDSAGNLYGATFQGGSGSSNGCGTIFQLKPAQLKPAQLKPVATGWTESLVRTFCSAGGNDGYFPGPGLIKDAAGNIYGLTASGGRNLGGVAFMLTPGSGGWTETVLHSFCLVGSCSNLGAQPVAGLILDAAGNLYGETSAGGQVKFGCLDGFPPGCGVVFKLTSQPDGKWTETVPHHFTGPDGGGPASSLISDGSGNLYGTTSYDGAFGFGTVFRMSPKSSGGWTTSILYNFRGDSGQGAINTGVVIDAAGNLYGASNPGGSCCSVVYKLTPEQNGRWQYSALYKFSGGQDGGEPSGSLIFDNQGNLYGVAGTGGANGAGVVFEITP